MITGATSGIGKATAYLLAEKGYRLILNGRRWSLLTGIEKELKKKSDILILKFDVGKPSEVEHAFDMMPDEWKNIDVLVNNAGLAAGFSKFQEGNTEDWEIMIDTNVKGLLYVTQKVVPFMIARNSGLIINISSIAGKEVYPSGNVYCATKSAVDALTKALRIDLLQHNIKVTGICPGMVETEFSLVRFKGNTKNAKNVYAGLEPLKGTDIAETIHFIITRPPHVNINDIVVMPTAQASATIVNRIG